MYGNYQHDHCPYFKKKKDKGIHCAFGKVEQENESKQNAAINQNSFQTNYFIVFCGSKGKWPKFDGITASNAPGQKVDLKFDEEGSLLVNGKALQGKEIADGVTLFALRERKVSNKAYGDGPEELDESVEEYPEPQLEDAPDADDVEDEEYDDDEEWFFE